MARINVDTAQLSIAFDEITEEIDTIIGQEVHKFYTKFTQKGRDVWDTGHFFRSMVAPKKRMGKISSWRIRNRADYASILWRGRERIGGRSYGSEKWRGGGAPMLKKLDNDIIRRTDAIER